MGSRLAGNNETIVHIWEITRQIWSYSRRRKA